MEDKQRNQALSDIILSPSEIWFLKYFVGKRNGVTQDEFRTMLVRKIKSPAPIVELMRLGFIEEMPLPINGIYYDHSHPEAPPRKVRYKRTEDGLQWMELHRAREKKFWIPTAASIFSTVISLISLAVSIAALILSQSAQ